MTQFPVVGQRLESQSLATPIHRRRQEQQLQQQAGVARCPLNQGALPVKVFRIGFHVQVVVPMHVTNLCGAKR